MSDSIDYFPLPDDGAVAKGSERSAWWIMLPRNAGTGGNGYMNARGLIGSGDTMPGFLGGGAGTYSFVSDLANGGYRRLRGSTSGAPVYVTLAPAGLSLLPSRMDATSTYAPPFAEVLIFRELIRTVASAPLPGGHQLLHGFSLVPNLLAGFPQLTAGSWRGIAICERTADVVLAIKNANPATLVALPGVSLSAARILVEHRLYMPNASSTGRYELWLNEVLTLVIPGTHPNFPHPLAITEQWAFMPCSLNNPGGAVQVDLNAWWGEIIIGPDSDGTF